ncbi:hypothetical protein GCM10008986_16630 [Salinibacillus aidingensis]|uniref:Uncharacterized protein n=1 Tax=Salinibacillus aidingensis TaxID=237684 RepID=A0ABP3L1B1_9BACI
MWGKRAQGILWFVSYTPVFMIAIYRYYFEDIVKGKNLWNYNIPENLLHVFFILILLFFSIGIYYFIPKLMFRNIERKISNYDKGKDIYIKEFKKPSLNDYTFFLLTLILPLITVDFKSIVSLTICIAVILFIILLLTKIDYIIACPIFFVSKYKVFNVSFVFITDKEEKYKTKGFVITKHDDLYNKKFKIVKLIKNVYYLK